MTGIAGCCARAASGHVAAAPPRRVTNARRFTRLPSFPASRGSSKGKAGLPRPQVGRNRFRQPSLSYGKKAVLLFAAIDLLLRAAPWGSFRCAGPVLWTKDRCAAGFQFSLGALRWDGVRPLRKLPYKKPSVQKRPLITIQFSDGVRVYF